MTEKHAAQISHSTHPSECVCVCEREREEIHTIREIRIKVNVFCILRERWKKFEVHIKI